MKPVYFVVGCGVLLTGCKLDAPVVAAETPVAVMEKAPVVSPVPVGVTPGGVDVKANEEPQVIPNSDGPREVDGQEPPPGIRVELGTDALGKQVLRVSEPGQLLALRHGDLRAVGFGKVSLSLGEDHNVPVIWERTDPKQNLETIRGFARLNSGLPVLSLAEKPQEAGEEKKGRHVCRAFHDGFGGFSVVCRVQGSVTAADLNKNRDPKERVFVQIGEPSVVRMELPMVEGAVEAAALGYAYSGMGLVMRAEGSWLAGESRASLAMLSAECTQPVAIRRFPHRPHPRRHPLEMDLF